jgi:hypothetical protein
MCKAAGITPTIAKRRYCAIYDGSDVSETLQEEVANILRKWPLDTLYASNSIQRLRRSVNNRFVDARHFGSFRRAHATDGAEVIVLDRRHAPKANWLQQLAVAKNVACADAAILLSPEAETTQGLCSRYVTSSQLDTIPISPLAIMIDSRALPTTAKSADLTDVLSAMTKTKGASVILVREGDFSHLSETR